jgi:uncharacterized tellurite resistance protein B-like protein
MRQYASDSPEAMARIIALSMLVDGGLDKSELDVMVRYGVLERLGMSDTDFEKIVHLLCEDMLQCVLGIHHGQIELDDDSIDGILSEIQDSRLRKTLLRIMLAVVDADQRLSDGEAVLISRAMQKWELDLIEVSGLVFAPAPRECEVEQVAYLLHHPKRNTSQKSPTTPSILETHF